MTDGNYARLLGELNAEELKLRAYIGYAVSDPAEAADIYQETWVRILGRARAQRLESPIAYAYRVARNLINDFYRRTMPTVSEMADSIPADTPLPDQILQSKQKMRRLRKAIDDMPPLRREVFTRRRLHGQSHQEIAADLGMTVTASEKHVSRALVTLYLALDDFG